MSDEELEGVVCRLGRIKIKFGDSYYENLIKKYKIHDPVCMTSLEEKNQEYLIVLDILNRIDDYEKGILNKDECKEMIEYCLVKVMQYQRRIDFSPYNIVNMKLRPELLDRHTNIGKMVSSTIPILRSGGISKGTKINNIKRINLAIVELTDMLYDDELMDDRGVTNIVRGMRKIKIKK